MLTGDRAEQKGDCEGEEIRVETGDAETRNNSDAEAIAPVSRWIGGPEAMAGGQPRRSIRDRLSLSRREAKVLTRNGKSAAESRNKSACGTKPGPSLIESERLLKMSPCRAKNVLRQSIES